MEDQNIPNGFDRDRNMQADAEAPAWQPYARRAPHQTQSPINDVEPTYVTRERYQTLEQASQSRKHMGVATSDPTYLAEAPLSKHGSEATPAPQPIDRANRGPRPKQTLTHSARYLQTPKPGRSIFISSQAKRKRSIRRATAAGLILIVVVVVVLLFILR